MSCPIASLSREVLIHGYGWLGHLRMGGRVLAATIELPWFDNHRNHSCIPCGIYTVKPYHSSHLGECFAFEDAQTKPRTAIRMHAANFPTQLRGCIAVGKYHGLLNDRIAVLDSRKTLAQLLGEFKSGMAICIQEVS